MTISPKNKKVLFWVVGLAIAAGLGYWAYTYFSKKDEKEGQ